MGDAFLADHSYIEGFVPSQADTQVFDALGSAPKDAHALRWYNHIKSFGAGMKQFAKASAGFSLGGAAAAAADDDDDVDLSDPILRMRRPRQRRRGSPRSA